MQFNIVLSFFSLCPVCSEFFFNSRFSRLSPVLGLFLLFFFFVFLFLFFRRHTSMHNTNSKKEKGKGQRNRRGNCRRIILNCRVEENAFELLN